MAGNRLSGGGNPLALLRLLERADNSGGWLLLGLAVGGLAWTWLGVQYGSGWWRQLLPTSPTGIIIHHSASSATADGQEVDVHLIDRWHERRGFGRAGADRIYHVGYHYVILPDGTIQRGRPERMQGAHCEGHNDQLGICLVGNFSSSANPRGQQGPRRPTEAQLVALDHLLERLIQRYGFTPADIHRHRDYARTACPGDGFPFERVVREAFR